MNGIYKNSVAINNVNSNYGDGQLKMDDNAWGWGFSAEYLYGGTLETNMQSTLPVAIGQRGDLVGSYENIGTLFLGAYFNWIF